VWCLASEGARHQPLFAAVGDRLCAFCGELASNDLVDALWAFAASDVAHTAFFEAAALRFVEDAELCRSLTFTDAVRVAWAFSAALENLELQAAVVQLLLPPPLLINALSAGGEHTSMPACTWPLLHIVLTVHEALRNGPGCSHLSLCAEQVAQQIRSKAGAGLRRELCAVLPKELHEDISQVAGFSQMLVDAALPAKRIAFDVVSNALVLVDLITLKSLPSGAAQLRRECLRRDGWSLRLIPKESLSSPLCRDALGDLLKNH